MRSTERGLSSSRGAPRANQDRVLGNIRLRTDTSADNRALVTELAVPIARGADPRHIDPCPRLVVILVLIDIPSVTLEGGGTACGSAAGRQADNRRSKWRAIVGHAVLFGSTTSRCPTRSIGSYTASSPALSAALW